MVDFYEFKYSRYAIEGDFNDIMLNPVASATSKWRMFKHLWWMQDLNQSTKDHETLNAERS
jgi:hypothetical protein